MDNGGIDGSALSPKIACSPFALTPASFRGGATAATATAGRAFDEGGGGDGGGVGGGGGGGLCENHAQQKAADMPS